MPNRGSKFCYEMLHFQWGFNWKILKVYVHNCYKTYENLFYCYFCFYLCFLQTVLRKKKKLDLEEATQFALDLPSDSENSDFDDLYDEEDFGPRNTSTGLDIHFDDNITVTENDDESLPVVTNKR